MSSLLVDEQEERAVGFSRAANTPLTRGGTGRRLVVKLAPPARLCAPVDSAGGEATIALMARAGHSLDADDEGLLGPEQKSPFLRHGHLADLR